MQAGFPPDKAAPRLGKKIDRPTTTTAVATTITMEAEKRTSKETRFSFSQKKLVGSETADFLFVSRKKFGG